MLVPFMHMLNFCDHPQSSEGHWEQPAWAVKFRGVFVSVIGNAWNDRRGAERDHGYCIFSITGDRGRVLCGSAIIGPLSESS
jgi:hypothetical protein